MDNVTLNTEQKSSSSPGLSGLPPPNTPAIMRPWEMSPKKTIDNPVNPNEDRYSIPLIKSSLSSPSHQPHGSNSTFMPEPVRPSQDLLMLQTQTEQAHLHLLQAFQQSPRISLHISIWIDSLLNSYIYKINSLEAQRATLPPHQQVRLFHDKLTLISQTRHQLATYQQMHTVQRGEELSPPPVGMFGLPAAVVEASTPSTPGTSTSTDTGYSSTPNASSSYLSLSSSSSASEGELSSPDVNENCMPQCQLISPEPSGRFLHPIPILGQPNMINFTSPESTATNNDQHHTSARLSSLPSETAPSTEGLSHRSAAHMAQLQEALAAQFAFHSANSTKYFQPCARFVLEDWYQANMEAPYASDEMADDLAKQAGISRAQVLKWLSNRRNRDGNTKRTVGRRPKAEYSRSKPYQAKSQLKF